MALLWVDGFEMYGPADAYASPSGVAARRYPGGGPLYMVSGRFGGIAAKLGWNKDLYSPALTTNSTLIIGFAFKCSALDVYHMVRLLKDSTLGVNLRLEGANQLVLYNGSTKLASAAVSLLPERWYYIELKVVTGSSGTYEVRTNEETVINGSGDTRPGGTESYHNKFETDNPRYSSSYYDDLYVLDGASGLSDFLGNVRVEAAYPNGDTSQHDYTRQPNATSDHYEYVDEATCNDDTDYVESGTAGDKDLFDYGSVSGVTSIKGVQLSVDCRNDDATDHDIIQVAKLNTTETDGPSESIGSQSYVTRRRVMENDPEGNAWTPANFNATQFGFKVG